MLCMRALCVTACDMLGCHAGELTHEKILKEILYLTTDEIRPYLAYARRLACCPGPAPPLAPARLSLPCPR